MSYTVFEKNKQGGYDKKLLSQLTKNGFVGYVKVMFLRSPLLKFVKSTLIAANKNNDIVTLGLSISFTAHCFQIKNELTLLLQLCIWR